MSFELVESSVLKICKICIHELVGLADHYFLSEFNNIDNQIAEVLSDNLRKTKIERANRERIEFWKSRGVDAK